MDIESFLIDKIVDRLMKEIILSSSFFLTPGVNQLTVMAVRWAVSKLVTFGEVRAYFVYVNVMTTIEAQALKKAIEVHNENPTQKNETSLIDAARKLIKLRP